MTTDSTQAIVPALANAGFSAIQIETMLRALLPATSNIAPVDYILGQLEDRLRQNGMTPDVSADWAKRMSFAWEEAGHPMDHELIEAVLPHFASRGLDASQAWLYADRVAAFRSTLADQKAAAPTINMDRRQTPNAWPDAAPTTTAPRIVPTTATTVDQENAIRRPAAAPTDDPSVTFRSGPGGADVPPPATPRFEGPGPVADTNRPPDPALEGQPGNAGEPV